MPTLNDSAYDRHRRIGQRDEPNANFRPQLGATLELFGVPVTLGPAHALVLLAAAVVGGVEGVMAVIVLFLGWIYMKSMPTQDAAGGVATAGASNAPRRPRERQPGLWGAIMWFVGPVPEGQAIAMGEALQSDDVAARPVNSASQRQAATASAAAASAPPSAAAVAAASAADAAKAAAARAAAARAAEARAAAAAATDGS